MGSSRRLLRNLDLDLIACIEAGTRPAKPKKTARKKPPRIWSSYRDAKRNIDRAKGWPAATYAKSRPLARSKGVRLNRSDRWPRAKTYAYAREISPSTEPVR